jgi:hypothetical protein
MTEADFWGHLEYRLSREFAGQRDRALRRFWCDGFVPREYHLEGQEPRIAWRAWIVSGQRQREWDFVLFLPRVFDSVEVIDWSALLPAEEVTNWLALDVPGERLQIEPAAAVPDGA